MTITNNTRKPAARAAAPKTTTAKAPVARTAAAKPAVKRTAAAKPAAKRAVAAKPAALNLAAAPAVAAPASTGPHRYSVLTGIDDSAFCERVSAKLDKGYELYGSPALTFNGKNVIVAQALVLKKLPKKRATKKKK